LSRGFSTFFSEATYLLCALLNTVYTYLSYVQLNTVHPLDFCNFIITDYIKNTSGNFAQNIGKNFV